MSDVRKTTDRMEPFVGTTRGPDWPKGGFTHPQGLMNRAARRATFRVNADRRTRMIVRAVKKRRLYGKPWAPTSNRDPRSHGEK